MLRWTVFREIQGLKNLDPESLKWILGNNVQGRSPIKKKLNLRSVSDNLKKMILLMRRSSISSGFQDDRKRKI